MNAEVKYDTRDSKVDTLPEGVKYAICAVSGGMDSATCLFHAVRTYGAENVCGVALYYGQRHDIELAAAKEECDSLKVRYIELDVTPIFNFNRDISALFAGSKKEVVQDKDYATLMHEKIAKGEAPISDEYIPNRNSLFINALCAIGLQVFEEKPFAVITGIHSDDVLKQEGSNVGAYPDCSPEFAIATNKALQISTSGLCYLYTPLLHKTKTQVAEFGKENGMTYSDFNKTWSCYKGGIEHWAHYKGRIKQCGRCPTCIDRINALVKAGIYVTVTDIMDNYDVTAEIAMKYMGK